MDRTMYFGGVEGGATHSNLVICDQTGKVVGRSKGPGTNHWSLGIEECARRVIEMLHAAKIDAGISLDEPLDSFGLTLSGCEQESSNTVLAARLKEKDKSCSREVFVASDTAGSLFTGAPSGGMVLIAGTGSNGLLRTPEGQQYGCGGWGHFLGDEGSAYWIAHRAVKTVFDHEDGLRPSLHSTERVWTAVQEHFNVTSQAELLPHVYKHFDKAQFAGLTSKLSQLAYEGDELAQHVFADAGSALAAHAAALADKAQRRNRSEKGQGEEGDENGGDLKKIRVVCVGSVWKSWSLLKPGTLKQLNKRRITTNLEFVRLRVSSAIGAAWLAAKNVNFDLPRDDKSYCEVFYTYTPNINKISKVNGHNGKENGVVGCGCSDWSYWS
ncbi:hypothetical protein KGM_208208 [Danaus plexippus plexippus]|uniref:N-acetyl-D-glucosamine kinase n=1 Tax=Danaus plexippus plexippus TaxID=278856 RepID=A0A212FB90_DANPL|nr:N-acetyl-D-glucosamine kinase [Danaus plexippus plexippus]OWR50989.1 hypothetical protein KGM_208208 [Danaus plexippus plexippus]